MDNRFKGVGVALVTPFDENGNIDFDALGRLVDNVIEGGVDYLVTLGTTAETPTLSHAERAAVAKFVRERNAGRAGQILGMGGNDTVTLCEQLREFDTDGFDAILSVVPYYNKPSQEGLFRHYKALAGASSLPVILYNIPGRSGVNMTAETTLRLAREVPGIVGVKEASGDIGQIEQIVKGAPEGFVVLSGDDGMTLPLISVGGHGVIAVMANVVPEKFARMVHTALDGDPAGARCQWEELAELGTLLVREGNPTGVKTALAVKGVCRSDVRLPLVEGSPDLREAMEGYFARG